MGNFLTYLENYEFELGENVIGGYIVNIEYDEFCETPSEYGNFGTFIAWHPRYILGDDHNYGGKEEFLHCISGVYKNFNTYGLTKRQLETVEKNAYKNNIILPVYLYDHSGIALSTSPFSCPWDSSQVGFIYISKKYARKYLGKKRLMKKDISKIEKMLEYSIETFSDYYAGNCYVYSITKNDEDIDSCGGFIGDIDKNGMTDYIRASIKADFKETSGQ